jgi:acid phosphatase type 7
MSSDVHNSLPVFVLLLCSVSMCSAQNQPVELTAPVSIPFRFAFLGDTRFTNPADTRDSNAIVRRTLVQGITDARPAFVSVGGDIVYHGDDANDWKTWDAETATWHEHGISVYPVLGNHDLSGGKLALENYFHRFPELKNNRYYAVHAANVLLFVLDSSMAESSGTQGEWLVSKLDNIPSEVEFVFVLLHHPPYTSSSEKMYGGGHSARSEEQELGKMLEKRQQSTFARFVVFSGHVHNYERHAHNGVTYFVSGGGGAHPYRIPRAPGDPFQDNDINYHFLLVEVTHGKLDVTMNRLQLKNGKAEWTKPDMASLSVAIRTHSSARKPNRVLRFDNVVSRFSFAGFRTSFATRSPVHTWMSAPAAVESAPSFRMAISTCECAFGEDPFGSDLLGTFLSSPFPHPVT